VPFVAQIPDDVRAYLDGLPLSPAAKERVNQFIEQVVADVSDHMRLDPTNRPDAAKPCFRLQYLFLDRWGDGQIHRIDFYILDHAAEFGVLVIAYAELFP